MELDNLDVITTEVPQDGLTDKALRELSALELASIGGGGGDIVFT